MTSRRISSRLIVEGDRPNSTARTPGTAPMQVNDPQPLL